MRLLLGKSINRYQLRGMLLLAALCWLTPLARAEQQEPTGSSQEIYRMAHQAMQEENWEGARRLLLGLWARAKTHDVAASLGEVEYRTENYVLGAYYLAFAAAFVPPQEKAETVEWYQALLADLKKHVATVRVVAPRDATLHVNGELVEFFAPESEAYHRELFLPPGEHIVEARLAPPQSVTKSLDVSAGHEYYVTFHAGDFTAPPPSPAPAPSPSSPSLLEGKSAPLLVAGTALAVGALAAGTFFTVAANKDKSEADRLRQLHGDSGCVASTNRPSTCDAQRDSVDAHNQKRMFATAGWIVAGAAAAGTLTYLFWPTREAAPERASRVRVEPSVSPLASGLWISGDF